jgi:alpha-1,6-mannosyltransferase
MTPSASPDTDRTVRNRFVGDPQARTATIGAVTLVLYMANDWVMHSLFLNGTSSSGVTVAGAVLASRSHLVWQVMAYVMLTAAMFIAYRAVLSICDRGKLQSVRARWWALWVPCVVTMVLVFNVPALSEDVFSYLAHGFLASIPGGNPLLIPAEAAADTAIGPPLAALGWHGVIGITPYGIVWTQIEVAVMKLCGTHVALALILMKAVVASASLGTAYCIWVFLGAAAPARQLWGTLAYLWNPLILSEFAGEGHNDAVMVFFVVAALAACAARRPVPSMVAQWLGFLTKYVPIIFVPAQFMYLWRTRRSVGRLALEILLALVITGVVAAILYQPLWAGAHSFEGLMRRGEPISSASPFGIIDWVLRRSPLASRAGALTVLCATLPLLGVAAWVSWRVEDARGLARAFAAIALAYVLIASPDYWPWYSCLPVALLIAADTAGLFWLVMLMSVTARLCAPLDLIRDHGFVGMHVAKGALTGLGTTVPLVALAVWWVRGRRRATARRSRDAA